MESTDADEAADALFGFFVLLVLLFVAAALLPPLFPTGKKRRVCCGRARRCFFFLPSCIITALYLLSQKYTQPPAPTHTRTPEQAASTHSLDPHPLPTHPPGWLACLLFFGSYFALLPFLPSSPSPPPPRVTTPTASSSSPRRCRRCGESCRPPGIRLI
jgi:hypothetical protein